MTPPPSTAATVTPQSTLRGSLLTGIAAAVILAAVGWGAWWYLEGSHHVSTDNAYVGADAAEVTPMVAGQVSEVRVSDTMIVHKGDILLQLDQRDAQIALHQAEADLAKAQRQFGQTTFLGGALAAQVQMRAFAIESAQAQLASAEAAFEKAKVDLDHRKKLAPSGAVSGEDLTAAVNAFKAADANLKLAHAAVAQATSSKGQAAGDLAATNALIDGATVKTAPDILAAQARVDQANLDLERTVIRAPIDGVINGRSVQVGQRVAPGASVMRIVPLDGLYVDANFKEGQLRQVRSGQSVSLTSDLYGDGQVYHGRVAGLSGGTGSAYALLPAQNATGNWIKVVQRLPVRVTLDRHELSAHPLRVGLSMRADIDTYKQAR